MMSINLSNIAILNIKGSNFLCVISLISKNDAINLLQNADFTQKSRVLQNIKNWFSYIKMGKETFGNTEVEKERLYRHKTPIFFFFLCRY